MKYNLMIILIVSLILIGNVSGENIEEFGDGFQKDSCIELKQVCASCTYVNLTISYPNSSRVITNEGMTSTGAGVWTYNFCNTSLMGRYDVGGMGDKDGTDTGFSFYFIVNYSGYKLDIARALIYLGLLTILILMFYLTIISIPKLPDGDNSNAEGLVLSINHLKYLRPILWGFAWALVLGIMFILSNISLAYLPTEMFGNLFFKIYQGLFLATLPMVVIWLLYILVSLFRDKKVKGLLERGVEIND